MNILCVGDIVGKPGRMAVHEMLDDIKKEYAIDFVIINGENSAGGSGITERIAKGFFHIGVDVITLGDHTWDQKEVEEYLNKTDRMIRPANFPENQGVPGRGWCIQEAQNGKKVAVINVLGRTFMRFQVDCPFQKLETILKEVRKETPIIIIDFHAETTSEKVAAGHFVDGRASFLFGTHTHIQTADDTILSKKTAYVTDLGMTGPYDSVIGQNKHNILKRFITGMPVRFSVAEKNAKLCGAVVSVDEKTGEAQKVQRIQRDFVSREVGQESNDLEK